MSQQALRSIGILLLSLGLLMALVILILQRRNRGLYSAGTRVNTKPVGAFYLVIYPYLSRHFLSKHAVSGIRSRMEIAGNTNERTIRKKTVQIYGLIMLILSLLLVVITMVTDQIVLILLFVAVLWFLSETMVDFFVIRQKNRLLKQQIKFNELIRHKYYETGMVDEAIYLACQSLDRHHFEIGLQGQRIHDILMARDIEKEMVAFNETAPNKYLKMLLGLSYMTMEYGDAKVQASSVFMRNLGDLTSEIRIELTKREQLNYALKSLNVIVLTPLFFIAPIRNWASSYFVPLKVFYESQTGFFLEIATVALIFLCYILLRRIQQFEEHRLVSRKNPMEERIYESLLHPLVDRLKPGLEKRHKLSRGLKSSGSPLSVEGFVTRQVMAFALGLIFSIAMFTSLHHNQRHQILTAPTLPENFLGGQLSEEELARAEAITAEDALYLSQITGVTSEEELLLLLSDKGLQTEELKLVASRLMAKQSVLFDQYFKWWELALCIVVALVATRIPVIYMYFQRKILRIELEDEVAGFASIILMLMHHQRISVEDVLEWMAIYATAFKEPLEDCLNNAASGLTESLEVLRETSDNERFVGIIDSLILASQDIAIMEAFEELSTEKDYYTEQRKETNKRIVERKINMGRLVGFTPLYGLIVLYMIIPIITASVKDMQQYLDQLLIG